MGVRLADDALIAVFTWGGGEGEGETEGEGQREYEENIANHKAKFHVYTTLFFMSISNHATPLKHCASICYS